jgi:hypothetical protein
MPFKKGQSGNPGGRRKPDLNRRAELERLYPLAIKALEAALMSDDPKVSFPAGRYVADQVAGTPVATVDANIETDQTITVVIPPVDELAK